MEQVPLGEGQKSTKFDQYSREELTSRYQTLEGEYFFALKEIYRLKNQALTDEQLLLIARERLDELNHEMFGSSSEKYKKSKKDQEKKPSLPRVKKPSERYPNVPVRKVELTLDIPPDCSICGKKTHDTGMREVSEQLTVIPKRYEVVEQSRAVYGCKCCHGELVTVEAPPRIMEGSSYSDDMIIDVSLSKYCDLIPIERYVAMAARSGVAGIPAQSLIECSHYLAEFGISIYWALKNEVMTSRTVRADETPHRMLEGSETKSWYLWGFSTEKVAYFECHDTRSGDVASEILKYSLCEVLLTDKYSGYDKATREANIFRLQRMMKVIVNAYCNAHSRRYFFKARVSYSEAFWYLDQYAEIYRLNDLTKGKPPDEVLKTRAEMRPYFETMRDRAVLESVSTPERGKFAKALRYFLKNYEGLTLCLTDPEVPIDNNGQERLLRSPIVGRKTWYGTHSERGAKTAAILFSIVESCKLNGVNPREYVPVQVENIKHGRQIQTPSEFAKGKT